MDAQHDVIVIGAGHNGLVCASYLARAGLSVLVLEARDVIGGACVTEELIPGAKWSSCAFVADLIRPEIVADLQLSKFGFSMYTPDTMGFGLFPDGRNLMLHRNVARTLRGIEKYSRSDAQRFLEFGARLRRFAEYMRPWLLAPPLSRAEVLAAFEQHGETELHDEFLRYSTRELLDKYFETDLIKGFFTFYGMVSVFAGPSTAGTSYVFGHHASGEIDGHFGVWGYVRGGMGGFTQALGAAATYYGATIRVNSPVAHVITHDGKAIGVALASGEEFHAPAVISNADPVRSMIKFLDADVLDADLRTRVSNIDQRGSMARIHLLIDELPHYIGLPPGEGPQHQAHQLLGASVENFENAYVAEQKDEIAKDYPIEAVIQSVTDPTLAPRGVHTLTLGVQQLPGQLASKGGWDSAKEPWADQVVSRLCDYAPNLKDHILDRYVITPKDLEDRWFLTGGNIFHAAMFDDQMFDGRPTPELAHYRTPVGGYYLCGAGTHPGGGVFGAPGHNAAHTVLADLKREPVRRPGTIPRPKLTDRMMTNRFGSRVSYLAARQPLFEPILNRASTVPIPKGDGGPPYS